MSVFDSRRLSITAEHGALIARPNQILPGGNGVYDRWLNPIITADHVPLHWRYDFSSDRNPFFMERIGVNAAFNAGAMKWRGEYVLAVRVEGVDRKSFFAIAQSSTGVDQFRFWDQPIVMPETDDPDTNVYDMRLVQHEDGWVYGLFCTERKDPAEPNSTSAAVAQCGIARTKDLVEWERLPDLISHAGQQRNVVLHPEFVDGKYAFYTRPQDGFISVGAGGGIGWGLAASMEAPEILNEQVIEGRDYHTIKEVKNGLGPAPIKTNVGWLHLAHGVRNTAAGLRYVLYLFVTHPEKPWEVILRPGGHLIAPLGEERVGDVSNVAFSNGWIADQDGSVFIYYASSDTRMHVATTSIDRLIDYAVNTPPDALRSAACVQQRQDLIDQNEGFWK